MPSDGLSDPFTPGLREAPPKNVDIGTAAEPRHIPLQPSFKVAPRFGEGFRTQRSSRVALKFELRGDTAAGATLSNIIWQTTNPNIINYVQTTYICAIARNERQRATIKLHTKHWRGNYVESSGCRDLITDPSNVHKKYRCREVPSSSEGFESWSRKCRPPPDTQFIMKFPLIGTRLSQVGQSPAGKSGYAATNAIQKISKPQVHNSTSSLGLSVTSQSCVS